jgi:hypothetical protein
MEKKIDRQIKDINDGMRTLKMHTKIMRKFFYYDPDEKAKSAVKFTGG